MAQIHKQTGFGVGIENGINASLERMIHEKARKIEEKHEYERNLQFLKGLNTPNAESIAHGTTDQITNLLRSKSPLVNINNGGGSNEFDQAANQFLGFDNPTPPQPGQAQPAQLPQQGQPSIDQVAKTPEAQQAVLAYIDTPEAQQEHTPEEIQKVRMNIERAMQQGQQPTQMLRQPGAPQGVQQGENAEFDIDAAARFLNAVPATTEAAKLNKAKELIKLKSGQSEEKQEARQAKIVKDNAPFLKVFTEYIDNAKDRSDTAKRALALVNDDKVTNGPTGLIPERILTSFNQGDSDFVKETSHLANSKALELRGPVGKAKLEAAQREKATLSDPKESKKRVLEREIENGRKAEILEQAYEEILAENGQKQPADFETKIRLRAKQISKRDLFSEEAPKEVKKQETFFAKKPKASDFPGKKIKLPDGTFERSNGTEWIKEQ